MKNKENLSHKHIKTILDSINEGVFTVDPSRKITSFNSAAEKITGVPRNEAINQYCYDIMHTNICQSSCAMLKTLSTGKEVRDKKIDMLNAKGRRIPVSISTALLKDENGNILGGVETFRDLSIYEELKKEITKKYTFEDIISRNHKIQEIFDILPNIAKSDSTVLIKGPSGSGKELFARAIHNLSNRKDKPFIAVNCGALPENLLESELFGYKKGAFTDAKSDKPGRFALAQKGTLFLDEIGDISPPMQVKLMRVLQEKEYEPLGATKSVKADVRIIAATNKDISKLVETDKFREDLFYRINVIELNLPFLKERQEDIPLLIDHFINRFSKKMGKNIIGITAEAAQILLNYDYPGNVRELENIIERSVVLCRSEKIKPEHLPPSVILKTEQKTETITQPGQLQKTEKQLIIQTLTKHKGHRGKTAEELGIDKSTLWRKMKKYNLMNF